MSLSANLCRHTYRALRRPCQRIISCQFSTPQAHYSSFSRVRIHTDSQLRYLSNSANPSSACWSCGHTHSPDNMFCKGCDKLQSFGGHDHNSDTPSSDTPVCFFSLLSQPKTVDVSVTSLETEYRQLQKVLHPDKYANASSMERDISLTNSSIVNQAYQVRHTRTPATFPHPSLT